MQVSVLVVLGLAWVSMVSGLASETCTPIVRGTPADIDKLPVVTTNDQHPGADPSMQLQRNYLPPLRVYLCDDNDEKADSRPGFVFGLQKMAVMDLSELDNLFNTLLFTFGKCVDYIWVLDDQNNLVFSPRDQAYGVVDYRRLRRDGPALYTHTHADLAPGSAPGTYPTETNEPEGYFAWFQRQMGMERSGPISATANIFGEQRVKGGYTGRAKAGGRLLYSEETNTWTLNNDSPFSQDRFDAATAAGLAKKATTQPIPFDKDTQTPVAPLTKKQFGAIVSHMVGVVGVQNFEWADVADVKEFELTEEAAGEYYLDLELNKLLGEAQTANLGTRARRFMYGEKAGEADKESAPAKETAKDHEIPGKKMEQARSALELVVPKLKLEFA